MSGRKNALFKFRNIADGDMSGDITSAITAIQYLDNVGVQVIWAGTAPVGTVSVEVSLDHSQDELGNVTVAGNWAAIDISPAPSVASNTGSIYIDLNQLSAPYIRVKFTRTSGTGVMNAYICGKAV